MGVVINSDQQQREKEEENEASVTVISLHKTIAFSDNGRRLHMTLMRICTNIYRNDVKSRRLINIFLIAKGKKIIESSNNAENTCLSGKIIVVRTQCSLF